MYELYEDDFDGYAYEKGKYRITHIQWNEHEQQIEIVVKNPCPEMDDGCGNGYTIRREDVQIYRH